QTLAVCAGIFIGIPSIDICDVVSHRSPFGVCAIAAPPRTMVASNTPSWIPDLTDITCDAPSCVVLATGCELKLAGTRAFDEQRAKRGKSGSSAYRKKERAPQRGAPSICDLPTSPTSLTCPTSVRPSSRSSGPG